MFATCISPILTLPPTLAELFLPLTLDLEVINEVPANINKGCHVTSNCQGIFFSPYLISPFNRTQTINHSAFLQKGPLCLYNAVDTK